MSLIGRQSIGQYAYISVLLFVVISTAASGAYAVTATTDNGEFTELYFTNGETSQYASALSSNNNTTVRVTVQNHWDESRNYSLTAVQQTISESGTQIQSAQTLETRNVVLTARRSTTLEVPVTPASTTQTTRIVFIAQSDAERNHRIYFWVPR